MSFIRRLMNYDTVDALIAIGYGHMEVIEELQQRLAQQELEKVRWGRDMVTQFLVALEKPEEEEELRENLHAALRDLSDHVARLEEHAR